MADMTSNDDMLAATNSVAENTRQDQQANLVEQGEKLPGVAKAMAAYQRFAPYAPHAIVASTPVVYSTGGNV